MDILTIVLLIIAGLFIGTVAPMIGIGGGLVNVPLLIFVFGVGSSSDATLMSSISVFLTSSSASLNYFRKKRLDVRSGLIFAAVAIPGGILGGYLAQRVITDSDLIKLMFAFLIGFTALFNLYRNNRKQPEQSEEKVIEPTDPDTSFAKRIIRDVRKFKDSDGDVIEYEVRLGIGAIAIFFGGMLAGLLGVGGGIIYVPTLSSISGLPFHIAAATSSFMIMFVVAFVLITRLSLYDGDILNILSYGLPLAIGSVIGARLGSTHAKKVQSKTLKNIFWTIAFFAAIRMGYIPVQDLLSS